MQKSLSIIIANTKRSESYFRSIKKNRFQLDYIFFYSTKKNSELLNEVKKYKLKKKIIVFKTNSINSKILKKSILNLKSDFILFSGYDAEIIKDKLILKKRILHCHPGLLPKYKGSTIPYYSLIQDNCVYVSLMIISKKIDSGKVIFVKKFKPPKKKEGIENEYDNFIRANTLISYLLSTKKNKIKKLKSKQQNFYYIAHPIIRNIVIKPKFLLKLNFYKKFI